VLSRKKNDPRCHLLSLVNRYGGMIVGTRGRESDHPSIGPVQIRLLLSAIGGKPERIESMDTKGFQCTTTPTHLVIDIDQIGHHAVIRLS